MSTYTIKCQAEINYWWEAEYRIVASDVSAAVSRALKLFRKEERLKRKHITRYKVEVTALN